MQPLVARRSTAIPSSPSWPARCDVHHRQPFPGVAPWPRSASRICTRRSATFIAVQDSNFTVDDGEFFVMLGPSGCGKTTTLAHDRRARTADRRARSCSTARTSPFAARRGARHRLRLPALRALSAHERAQEHRLSRWHARAWRGARSATRVEETARLLRIDHLLDQPVSRPLRRRPAARRARPRHRAAAEGLPDGRAARRARCRVPRPDVRRAARAARPHRRDHGLRHARPARGDVDGRPDRGHEPRRRRADRHAAGDLRSAGHACSWPTSSARRR